jgi:valyl-tRNA synthetase
MLHGVVCDGQGRKMSKSLGNVVDPLSVINGRSLSELEQDLKETGGTLMTEKELQRSLKALKVTFPNGIPKCGTDALRFSLVHNDPKSQQLNIDVQFVNTCASFCNKIWQAARFFILSHERGKGTYTDDISNHHVSDEKTLDWITSTYGVLDIEDKWILSRCGVTVKNMNSYLESRDFHLASRCLRTFLYTNMCDVYVEAAKPVLNDATNAEFHIKYNVMKICLITALKLLHPIMPFITEEIYQRIRVTTALSESSELHESIMTLNYPREEEWEAFISNNIMTDMEVVLEFVTCIRNSKSLYSLKWDDKPDILIIDRISSADVCFDNKNIIQEYSSLISKLSSCGKVEILQEYIDPETQSDYLLQVQKWSCTELPKYNSSVYVNVSEYLDINKELQKLTNQRTKTLKEFDNLKKKFEKRKQTISEVEKQKFTDKFERLSKMENVLNRNIK